MKEPKYSKNEVFAAVNLWQNSPNVHPLTCSRCSKKMAPKKLRDPYVVLTCGCPGEESQEWIRFFFQPVVLGQSLPDMAAEKETKRQKAAKKKKKSADRIHGKPISAAEKALQWGEPGTGRTLYLIGDIREDVTSDSSILLIEDSWVINGEYEVEILKNGDAYIERSNMFGRFLCNVPDCVKGDYNKVIDDTVSLYLKWRDLGPLFSGVKP